MCANNNTDTDKEAECYKATLKTTTVTTEIKKISKCTSSVRNNLTLVVLRKHSGSALISVCSFLLVLQIFGLESILGSDSLWPLLLALTILPAILQSIMLPFCPESPRYLLIVLNQEEEARKGGWLHTSLHN